MPHLTRDQRIQVLTLHSAGFSHTKIAQQLKITLRQAQYTCRMGHPSPKKRSGRPRALSDEQIQQLVAFVAESTENRTMSYAELADGPFKEWGVSKDIICRTLSANGFRRLIDETPVPFSGVGGKTTPPIPSVSSSSSGKIVRRWKTTPSASTRASQKIAKILPTPSSNRGPHSSSENSDSPSIRRPDSTLVPIYPPCDSSKLESKKKDGTSLPLQPRRAPVAPMVAVSHTPVPPVNSDTHTQGTVTVTAAIKQSAPAFSGSNKPDMSQESSVTCSSAAVTSGSMPTTFISSRVDSPPSWLGSWHRHPQAQTQHQWATTLAPSPWMHWAGPDTVPSSQPGPELATPRAPTAVNGQQHLESSTSTSTPQVGEISAMLDYTVKPPNGDDDRSSARRRTEMASLVLKQSNINVAMRAVSNMDNMKRAGDSGLRKVGTDRRDDESSSLENLDPQIRIVADAQPGKTGAASKSLPVTEMSILTP